MAEEQDNDPRPKPFPPELTENGEGESIGHMVREYIWGKGPIEYLNVSGNLNRDWVLKFVEFEIDGLPSRYFWRVRILADLYNLTEIVPTLDASLNHGEKEADDLDRSIASAVVLQEIGDEQNKKKAQSYFSYMVSTKFADERYPELIECLASFGDDVEADELKSKMEKDIETLIAQEDSDPQAATKGRDIEDLYENEFFFIEEANESRKRINSIDSPARRLNELISAYFELTDDGGAEYFQLWNQQQIRRHAEKEGPDVVIKALRNSLGKVGKSGGANEEFCKIRCYNAIEFFNGRLEPDESEFMSKNASKQVDPLKFVQMEFHWKEPLDDEDDVEDEDLDETNEGENDDKIS